jgi:hypothetical protein
MRGRMHKHTTLFLAAALAGCTEPSTSRKSASISDGLQITTALALSSGNAAPGQTLTGTVTYTNVSAERIDVLAAVIAARPPGGSHAGGPYDDFGPYAPATSLAPGESLTVNASETFDGSITGTWDVYPTYEDADGVWHDGPDQSFTVGTQGSGLSTRGNQIVDANGTPVRIASVGWNEIGAGPLQGFDANVAAMAQAGFNCIRVSWVNATRDQNLAVIDQVVAAASAHGLWVILDNHTNEPGHGDRDNWGAQQKNGLWYDLGGATDNTDGGGNPGSTTDAQFLADWVTVAQHYAGNATVIGYDLRNEPLEYGGMSTWGDGNFDTDIRWMYERVGNAVLAVDPTKLIIAEGPQNYTTQKPWGDLSHVGDAPVNLDVPDHVVYSIHDYPHEIAGYSPDNGDDKIAQMNAAWGYLVIDNIAPVWIGEMGSSMQDSTDWAWAQTLVDYTNGNAPNGPRFAPGERGIGTDWWAWGALDGQLPDGTQNDDGSLRQDQYSVYSQLR